MSECVYVPAAQAYCLVGSVGQCGVLSTVPEAGGVTKASYRARLGLGHACNAVVAAGTDHWLGRTLHTISGAVQMSCMCACARAHVQEFTVPHTGVSVQYLRTVMSCCAHGAVFAAACTGKRTVIPVFGKSKRRVRDSY